MGSVETYYLSFAKGDNMPTEKFTRTYTIKFDTIPAGVSCVLLPIEAYTVSEALIIGIERFTKFMPGLDPSGFSISVTPKESTERNGRSLYRVTYDMEGLNYLALVVSAKDQTEVFDIVENDTMALKLANSLGATRNYDFRKIDHDITHKGILDYFYHQA